MANQNIQIGIDLGTTNSEVAVAVGDRIELVKNIYGDEYTPSVFGIDRAGNRIVGKRAHEKLYKDASVEELRNNKAEIKRLMGTAEKVHFERIHQNLNAEEISAEILKGLKEDILRKYPEFHTEAAVITIPAHFSTLQAEATKRAGNLSGFDHVVLLQEPIAAAIACGFGATKNENWIVYDLGGGTFDVAVISSRDGALSVLGHDGDNFLGGKDFDLMLVDEVIVPRITDRYRVRDFYRGNPKYTHVFAKLKHVAETAKVCLSQMQNANVEIEGVGSDEAGEEIYLNFDVDKSVLERLIAPFIDKTIELTEKTIQSSGVEPARLDKMILVGASTQMPYVRDRLTRQFRLPIGTSVDPLTIVARGACIFAAGQQMPRQIARQAIPEGERLPKNAQLFFESLTSETEEPVSGVIEALQDTSEEHYVQIQADSGFYSGSKVQVKAGKFHDVVALEQHKTNLFWIYLFDSSGNAIPILPDSFSISHGISITGTPIPHSIGVAVAKKDFTNRERLTEVFDVFFERNSILPLRATKTYYSVIPLENGDSENVLPVKVYEGESVIPDRNQIICDLRIAGKDVLHDLPARTEIEITLEVNESREVTVEAFVPSIDFSLDARATTHAETADIGQMEIELEAQKDRLKTIEANCTSEEQGRLHTAFQALSTSLRHAHSDEDDKRKALKELKDLKIDLDELEEDKEMAQLVDEFDSGIDGVREMIDELGEQSEASENVEHLQVLEREGRKAISEDDKHLLMRTNEQVHELGGKVLYASPGPWLHQLEQFTNGDYDVVDEGAAAYYIDKGNKAVDQGDFEELRRCVGELMSLLDSEDVETLEGNISGITH